MSDAITTGPAMVVWGACFVQHGNVWSVCCLVSMAVILFNDQCLRVFWEIITVYQPESNRKQR